jgi:hypothetical protein
MIAPVMEKNTASPRLPVIRFTGVTLLAVLVVFFYRIILHVNQTTVALTFLFPAARGHVHHQRSPELDRHGCLPELRHSRQPSV